MINKIETCKRLAFSLAILAGLVGCGTAYKEKTAPCKRPANLTSYTSDPRHECGPMRNVNEDPVAAIEAITN